MISKTRFQEPLQLPSWSLGTLAFEKPATIYKGLITLRHPGHIEDEMPRGRGRGGGGRECSTQSFRDLGSLHLWTCHLLGGSEGLC